MTTHTNQQVIEALSAALEKRGPEWIDPNAKSDLYSQYSDSNGEPLCLIGEVIHALSPEGFKEMLEYLVEFGASPPSYVAFEDAGIELDSETRFILREAQQSQDRGESWGTVVPEAINAIQALTE